MLLDPLPAVAQAGDEAIFCRINTNLSMNEINVSLFRSTLDIWLLITTLEQCLSSLLRFFVMYLLLRVFFFYFDLEPSYRKGGYGPSHTAAMSETSLLFFEHLDRTKCLYDVCNENLCPFYWKAVLKKQIQVSYTHIQFVCTCSI